MGLEKGELGGPGGWLATAGARETPRTPAMRPRGPPFGRPLLGSQRQPISAAGTSRPGVAPDPCGTHPAPGGGGTSEGDGMMAPCGRCPPGRSGSGKTTAPREEASAGDRLCPGQSVRERRTAEDPESGHMKERQHAGKVGPCGRQNKSAWRIPRIAPHCGLSGTVLLQPPRACPAVRAPGAYCHTHPERRNKSFSNRAGSCSPVGGTRSDLVLKTSDSHGEFE